MTSSPGEKKIRMPSNDEDLVMLGFRVPRRRRKQINSWLGEHDLTLKEVLESALESALSKRPKPAPKKLAMVEKKTSSSGQDLSYNLRNAKLPEAAEWLECATIILGSQSDVCLFGLCSNITGFLSTLLAEKHIDVGSTSNARPPLSIEAIHFTELLERARRLRNQLGRTADDDENAGTSKRPAT
jgi:hypothetical protein